MSPIKVFVPGDSAALSVGADEVALEISRLAGASNIEIDIVRNGTRGALWLEPLIEVQVDEDRIGYGPVSVEDVAALFQAQFHVGGSHHLCIGKVAQLPWLAKQDRITFKRVGIVDPHSMNDYQDHGGLVGLRHALHMSPENIVSEVAESGLRGRGGAGFPAGIKWRTVLETKNETKYICCNADEGDSGTYADRILIEGDPFTLIEGMVIAGIAVGAKKGFIYIRSEYPAASAKFAAAVEIAREFGLLGGNILGSEYEFDIKIRVGGGSYVCGEETAMLESIEGKRGVVRSKPPLPAISGLFGKPTVINNVLTFASVPAILADGAASYKARGVGRSLGTQVFQLGGNVKRGGIVETGFGITLGELIAEYGDGSLSGNPIKAVQVGGPLGAYFSTKNFEIPMDYESLIAAGGMLGHGGIVIFDSTVDLAIQARFAMEFCALESCGKCTPCRLGSTRGAETIQRIIDGEEFEPNRRILLDLCEVMTDGSLCAMGGLTPMPVMSAMINFPEEFENRVGGMK